MSDNSEVTPSKWLLGKRERGNAHTRLDDQHPGDEAWSSGNLATALVHGSAYFRELLECLAACREGDLVLFTDWEGAADERLTGLPGSEVLTVLSQARDRGADVRGLIWRSHSDLLDFSARKNRTLGEELQDGGAEVLLDMRVRVGGAHHQKFVVIRHHDDPTRDVAFVGGIDLAHSRRDDAQHQGDPQALEMAEVYGATPPWHDIQVALRGPAVHDVETVFRERWEDSTPLSVNPVRWLRDKVQGLDTDPDPLPEQAPPPPRQGDHLVQILRTAPRLGPGRAHDFAPDGEFSIARGYTKAIRNAHDLVYVEDQYLWGREMASVFVDALREQPDLHVVAVIPMVPEGDNPLVEHPQQLGRIRALDRMLEAAPGRVALYGIENHDGVPVYVHAKVCVVDDTWATVGSDNFNRRSWTHDSELTAAVLDRGFAHDLRLGLMAEHLDLQPDDVARLGAGRAVFEEFEARAAALDAWHDGGRQGPRPPGRLRTLPVPEMPRHRRAWASVPYRLLHDPDGRAWVARWRGRF